MLPKMPLTSNTATSSGVSWPLSLTFEQLASNSRVPSPPSDLLEQFTEFSKALHLTILVLLEQKDTNQNQPKRQMPRAKSGRVLKASVLSSSGMPYPQYIGVWQYTEYCPSGSSLKPLSPAHTAYAANL